MYFSIRRTFATAFMIGCWALTSASSPGYIKYNDLIYIQSMRKESMWLTGARGGGSTLSQRNRFSDDELSKTWHYEWYPRLASNHEDKSCVKYGDEIIMRVYKGDHHKDARYLVCGRYSKNEECRTQKFNKNELKQVWKIRSNHGDGDFNSEDPKTGDCLEDVSPVFLQLKGHALRWLFAREDGGVTSLNILSGDAEKRIDPAYQWILRKQPGNGSTLIPVHKENCYAKDAQGYWEWMKDSNGDQDITYGYGVTK